MNKIERELIACYNLKDFDKIQNTYIELLNTRSKMDRWFDKFLDKFSDKLTDTRRDDPVKRLYNQKYEEYVYVSRCIKIAENYIGGTSV